MKIACPAVLTLLLCVLYSCSKDSKDPDVTDNTPLRLIKRITRFELNGQIITDSTVYTYDTAGHLTATIDAALNLPRRKFIYGGDTLLALIDYYANGKADTLKRPIKYFDNGNTILLDHTRPNQNGGIDTIQLTYKWSGNQLLEAWTYLRFAGQPFGNLQKRIISYNTSGNENENATVSGSGTSQWQWRGLAYDQNKNFFNTVPRLNYIFMGSWGAPGATRSVNNPVKGEWVSGVQEEYIWTYNNDGYPLTMQVKGKNYLAMELQYNK